MPRRREVAKREIIPDAKYGSKILAKFMNHVMVDGKKSVAETIVYGALEVVKKHSSDPLEVFEKALDAIPGSEREALHAKLGEWLEKRFAVLEPLAKLETASRDLTSGPELRALLIRLVEHGGMLTRDAADLTSLSKEQHGSLRRLGVKVGALDLFVQPMLRPAAQTAWFDIASAKYNYVAPATE